jgi:hypothetical protein
MSNVLPVDINPILITAIHQQNRVRWDLFLKGCVTNTWSYLYYVLTSQPLTATAYTPWRVSLTILPLTVYKAIWDDRNKFVHGLTLADKTIGLTRILEEVTSLYRRPRKTGKHKIMAIPLEQCLRHCKTNLNDG